jgi:hypothetical protein
MSPLWDTFSGSLRSTEYRAPHSRPLPFLIVQTLLCARTSVCGDWLHVVLTVQMPKVVKQSTAWSGVDTLVKNFLASLPLVSDLHHPSMRDRHWDALRAATGARLASPLPSTQLDAEEPPSFCAPTHEHQNHRSVASLRCRQASMTRDVLFCQVCSL